MNLNEEAAFTILTEAASSRFGLIVRIQTIGGSDVVTPALRARQLFYRIRREIGGPETKDIQIRLSPTDPDNELWLIKGIAKPKAHALQILTLEDLDI